MEQGLNINHINKDGNSLLIETLNENIYSDSEILIFIEKCIEYNINLNFQNEKSDTALLIATRLYNNNDIVELLLSNGANPNIATIENFTPLHESSQSGNYEMTKMLLDYGSDPNILFNDTDSPLHFAVGNNYHDVVEFLLSKGAETTYKNYKGKTAFDLARDKKMISILRENSIRNKLWPGEDKNFFQWLPLEKLNELSQLKD